MAAGYAYISGTGWVRISGSGLTLGSGAQQAAPGDHTHVGMVHRVVYTGGAYPTRPANATYVEWVGPVAPTGALVNDTWVSTA